MMRRLPRWLVAFLLLDLAIMSGLFGWAARGFYEDHEFARTTARLCEEGIICLDSARGCDSGADCGAPPALVLPTAPNPLHGEWN